MKKFGSMVVLLALCSCGEEERAANSTAKGVSSLATSFVSSLSSTDSILLAQKRVRAQLQTQKRLDSMMAKVKGTELKAMTDMCPDLEASMASEIGSECTFESCEADSEDLSSLSFTMACSGLEDQTMTCGADSYTLSNFDYTVATNMDLEAGEYAFSMNMAGDVSGSMTGEIDCSMSMEITSSTTGLDCDDTNFSCTFAGTPITCAELETSASTTSCTE